MPWGVPFGTAQHAQLLLRVVQEYFHSWSARWLLQWTGEGLSVLQILWVSGNCLGWFVYCICLQASVRRCAFSMDLVAFRRFFFIRPPIHSVDFYFKSDRCFFSVRSNR